jgi:hypothetical protein
MKSAPLMTTDAVAPGERAAAWRDWVWTHFGGLESDLYGDTGFDGHMSASQAGDVVLTKLEANRHRVLRSPRLARASDTSYLKIVAPWQGSAAVEQQGRQAWVKPGGWAIYDTAGSYEIANPERVEHLIVMLPREQLAERGLRLEPLMARHVGGASGISRVALEAMRSTFQELPAMNATTARGAGAMIIELVRLSRRCCPMCSRMRSRNASSWVVALSRPASSCSDRRTNSMIISPAPRAVVAFMAGSSW